MRHQLFSARASRKLPCPGCSGGKLRGFLSTRFLLFNNEWAAPEFIQPKRLNPRCSLPIIFSKVTQYRFLILKIFSTWGRKETKDSRWGPKLSESEKERLLGSYYQSKVQYVLHPAHSHCVHNWYEQARLRSLNRESLMVEMQSDYKSSSCRLEETVRICIRLSAGWQAGILRNTWSAHIPGTHRNMGLGRLTMRMSFLRTARD